MTTKTKREAAIRAVTKAADLKLANDLYKNRSYELREKTYMARWGFEDAKKNLLSRATPKALETYKDAKQKYDDILSQHPADLKYGDLEKAMSFAVIVCADYFGIATKLPPEKPEEKEEAL